MANDPERRSAYDRIGLTRALSEVPRLTASAAGTSRMPDVITEPARTSGCSLMCS